LATRNDRPGFCAWHGASHIEIAPSLTVAQKAQPSFDLSPTPLGRFSAPARTNGSTKWKGQRDNQRKTMSTSSTQSAAYGPEELSLLGEVLDRAVEALPPGLRTASNRNAIARNILSLAATGVRDPLALEQAATLELKITVAATSNTGRLPSHTRQSHNRPAASARLPSFRQTRMASSVNE
jgi:hypothetical protein